MKEPKISSMQKIKRFIKEMVRVLKVTKKPDQQEFSTIVKMSALGSAIIGLIGFIVEMIGLFLKGSSL